MRCYTVMSMLFNNIWCKFIENEIESGKLVDTYMWSLCRIVTVVNMRGSNFNIEGDTTHEKKILNVKLW